MMAKKIQYEPIKEDDIEFNFIDKYAKLLSTSNWRQRRREILEKDGKKCTTCKAGATIKLWDQPVYGIRIIGKAKDYRPVIEPVFGKKHISLHVHHKLYVLERNPWNYSDKELITLCFDCHMKVHEVEIIPVYLREIDLDISKNPNIISCPRCGGDGHLPEYNYYQSGLCFGCQGKCFVRLK